MFKFFNHILMSLSYLSPSWILLLNSSAETYNTYYIALEQIAYARKLKQVMESIPYVLQSTMTSIHQLSFAQLQPFLSEKDKKTATIEQRETSKGIRFVMLSWSVPKKKTDGEREVNKSGAWKLCASMLSCFLAGFFVQCLDPSRVFREMR